ncbi:RNA polymerase sigma factor [Anaerorhabdus sp.]|uniref:RNA polymerase sigma factor n=1 Tax=Anaerorhabdus sp. TaxID=1872524 RepID=UPI002FCBA569
MLEKKKEYFDIKYVIQFQKGDKDAFDFIFNYYRHHVYWTGINFFSNEEKAKDLVQSVFLEIYQNINKLKEPAKFYPWMNRIAYTRCMQMLRYEMKDSLHYTNDLGDEFADNFIEDKKSDDPITYVQKEQIKEIIIKEIEELSPKYRTICYLRFFEDLSYTEISEITQVPLGTITNYIGRLKPKLQKALQKNGFSSASCLSLVMLPNIIEYFKAFIDMKTPLIEEDSKVILEEVKQSTKLESNKEKKSWQIAAYSCIGLALLLPIGVSVASSADIPIINKFNGKNAMIEDVTYPQVMTNKPFKVQIKLSNENYDEVLLNDKADMSVYWNGEYTIRLMRKGKEIDRKNISISNIDRDIPIVTEQLFTDGIMTLRLDDEDSQVNFEQIEFYENGTLTNNFTLDKEKKELYISKEVATNNVLKVSDIAGNVLEVKIVFYEINAIK